jgi:acyl dehydratase
MGAWILDYLAGWAGQWGSVTHCNAQYRGPAFIGDITILNAEITDKKLDDEGRKIVQVKCTMENQENAVLATAKASIALPVR